MNTVSLLANHLMSIRLVLQFTMLMGLIVVMMSLSLAVLLATGFQVISMLSWNPIVMGVDL